MPTQRLAIGQVVTYWEHGHELDALVMGIVDHPLIDLVVVVPDQGSGGTNGDLVLKLAIPNCAGVEDEERAGLSIPCWED